MLIHKELNQEFCECECENDKQDQAIQLLAMLAEELHKELQIAQRKIDLLSSHLGVEFDIVAPKPAEMVIKNAKSKK